MWTAAVGCMSNVSRRGHSVTDPVSRGCHGFSKLTPHIAPSSRRDDKWTLHSTSSGLQHSIQRIRTEDTRRVVHNRQGQLVLLIKVGKATVPPVLIAAAGARILPRCMDFTAKDIATSDMFL
jgi:hypothetical protein